MLLVTRNGSHCDWPATMRRAMNVRFQLVLRETRCERRGVSEAREGCHAHKSECDVRGAALCVQLPPPELGQHGLVLRAREQEGRKRAQREVELVAFHELERRRLHGGGKATLMSRPPLRFFADAC